MLQLHNMHRDYNSGHFGNEEVSVFTGLEIEHTLAYGKQTLFLATNNLSTDEILELANLYESIVQTKTNYFMDGTKHERMSNAIKSKVSLFTSLKRPKVEELVDDTIGTLGFTEDGLKAFMKALEKYTPVLS